MTQENQQTQQEGQTEEDTVQTQCLKEAGHPSSVLTMHGLFGGGGGGGRRGLLTWVIDDPWRAFISRIASRTMCCQASAVREGAPLLPIPLAATVLL